MRKAVTRELCLEGGLASPGWIGCRDVRAHRQREWNGARKRCGFYGKHM